MYEHGVLRRIFGFKREDVTGEWRENTVRIRLDIIRIIESEKVS